MLTVFVDPQRCIGCLQCEFACAVEHSHSRDPVVAFHELPVPRKRVHVQAGPAPNTAFPNKCRHCDPAPCQQVCPTGAIYRDVGLRRCPDRHVQMHRLRDVRDGLPVRRHHLPPARRRSGTQDRRRQVRRLHRPACGAGRIPACAEVCKVDALRFGDVNEFVAAGQRRETAAVFAATSAEPMAAVPDTIGAWRDLGATVGAARRCAMTALDRDGRQRAAVVTLTIARRRAADARARPGRGDPDRVGPRDGPGAAMRVLLARRVLPQLLHGSVPDRPVRRRARRSGSAVRPRT